MLYRYIGTFHDESDADNSPDHDGVLFPSVMDAMQFLNAARTNAYASIVRNNGGKDSVYLPGVTDAATVSLYSLHEPVSDEYLAEGRNGTPVVWPVIPVLRPQPDYVLSVGARGIRAIGNARQARRMSPAPTRYRYQLGS